MHDRAITQLHQILDQERRALITADFDALASFVSEKEDLLLQMEESSPPRDALRSIRRKMDENLTLLAAAIKGVTAAGERLADLQNVKAGLSVYDHAGRLELVRTHNPALEKKA